MKQLVFLVVCCCWCNAGYSQPDYLLLRSGDELYRTREFEQAETMYRKATELEPKPATSFNLGNAVYQQNRISEAVEAYKKTIATTTDPVLKSNAHYNLGNAYYQQQNFEESVKSYKEALKLQPDDVAAKKNLVLAMRQLKQQQEQQKDNKQQQQEQQQDQQQQQQDQQQQQQQQKQQQSSAKEDVNDKEAKEILKAIEREDQRVQGKLKKPATTKNAPVKDW